MGCYASLSFPLPVPLSLPPPCPHSLFEARMTEGGRQSPALSHHGQQAGRHLAGTAVSLENERLLIEITNRSI